VKYLVDSDWVAVYLKGKEQAVSLLDNLADEGIAISILSFGEIREGIIYGEDRPKHETGFRNFLRGVDVLPLTRDTMNRFASIRGELRKRGDLIGDMDLLIASTALHYQLSLISRNLRHFRRVPQLDIYRP
jgi:tRNA(fMet)-specific endonuclease VapC